MSYAAARRSRTSPRRPSLLRLGCRLAAGVDPAHAARAEAVPADEAEALLARPDFAEVVAACRSLMALPEAERLARLERVAWTVLEAALAEGDVRAAVFVLVERRHGRSPAATLAVGASAAVARAATEPHEPPPAPRPQTGPAATPLSPPDPDRVARACAPRLRNLVLAENAVQHGAEPEPDDADADVPSRERRRPVRGVVVRTGLDAAAVPPTSTGPGHRRPAAPYPAGAP